MTNSTSKFYITQAQIWADFTDVYCGTLSGKDKTNFMKSKKGVLQNFHGRIFNSGESNNDRALQKKQEYYSALGMKRQLLFRTDECLGEPLF